MNVLSTTETLGIHVLGFIFEKIALEKLQVKLWLFHKFLKSAHIFDIAFYFRSSRESKTPAIPIRGHKRLSTRQRHLQRCIQKPVKHLRWNDFAKTVNGLKPLTFSQDRSILDV